MSVIRLCAIYIFYVFLKIVQVYDMDMILWVCCCSGVVLIFIDSLAGKGLGGICKILNANMKNYLKLMY